MLAAVFRFTRFGLLTRAAAETQTGAFVSGVSPDRVALLNWMISAAVAGAAGILIAPISPLTPDHLHPVRRAGAGRRASSAGSRACVPTVVAGLAIGMLQSEAINAGQRAHLDAPDRLRPSWCR